MAFGARTTAVVVVVVMMVGLTLVSSQDYCTICKDHTMCLYKGAASACGKTLATGVKAGEKTEILQKHNELRRKVANNQEPKTPEAANMRELKWDDELAKVAQMWADQCAYGHDNCRDVPRFKVGQNVRKTSSSTADTASEWSRGIQSWYDEVSIWKASNVDPFQSVSGAGHFTQVVWGETYLIGCGYIVFTAGGTNTKYYVCNYGPRGNTNGKPMYIIGKACSKCPPGTTCKSGLCG